MNLVKIPNFLFSLNYYYIFYAAHKCGIKILYTH